MSREGLLERMLAYLVFTMASIQSSLKPSQLNAPLNDDELLDYARRAYHKQNKSLVDINELADPFFKQAVINYSDNKYGKRK